MVTMDEPMIEIGDKIVSKALDNRVACWLGIEAIRVSLLIIGVPHIVAAVFGIWSARTLREDIAAAQR